MFTIVLEPETFQDLDQIAQWYRQQGGDALSERFLEQFYLAISQTTTFPNSYPFFSPEYSAGFDGEISLSNFVLSG